MERPSSKMYDHSMQVDMSIELNLGLPEVHLATDQIKKFESIFFASFATLSRNAQPDKNFLGYNDQANVLIAQSDVKLDLLFAFCIREGSLLEDAYKTFLNNTIRNFPLDAEKTHVAVLVFSGKTIWKFSGSANQANVLKGNPSFVSDTWEVLVENINMMFEAGLQGEPRAAKRVALIWVDRLPFLTNATCLKAAHKRREQMNVKSIVISTIDVPQFMKNMTSDYIKLNTTDAFHAFVKYTSPSIRLQCQ